MPDNLLQYFPKPMKKVIPKTMWHQFLKIYNQLDYVTAPSNTASDRKSFV